MEWFLWDLGEGGLRVGLGFWGVCLFVYGGFVGFVLFCLFLVLFCLVSVNQDILVRVELGMKKFPEAAENSGVSKPGILRISK